MADDGKTTSAPQGFKIPQAAPAQQAKDQPARVATPTPPPPPPPPAQPKDGNQTVTPEAKQADPNRVGDKVINDTSERIVGISPSLVEKVQLDQGESYDHELRQTLAQISAADSGVIASDTGEGILYSSHPIANLTLGRFQFEKSLLRLSSKDSADFDALLSKMPPIERNRVQKIDEAAASQIVRERLESRPTRQFDSSVGLDTLSALRAVGPTKGTGRLEDQLEEPLMAASRVEGFVAGKHDQNESVPGEVIKAIQDEQGDGDHPASSAQ